MKTIYATYENGMLKPSELLELPSGARVELLLCEPQDDPVAILRMRYPDSFGGMSPEVGEELKQIIEEEFGHVNLDEWK